MSSTSTITPLRVALVAHSLVRAGAEKQFVYMAQAFKRLGVGLKVFYLGTGDHYDSVLQASGIPMERIPCITRAWHRLWKLSVAMRRFQPDLVLASQFGDVMQAGLAGRANGAMVISGIRSNGFWEMSHHGRRSWLMSRLPHAFLANSHLARANLESLGFDSNRIAVLPNAIDLAEFDRQSEASFCLDARPDQVVVVAVGRLTAEKRFDRFIGALALLPPTAPPVLGVLVGADYGKQAELEAQAKRLGLGRDRLMVFGDCKNVPALLKRAHMLALCSDWEGFPNVILEAMAAGLPVVTTPAGDAPRIVRAEETGFVVGFDDSQGLSERIRQLAESTELRGRLGREARRVVERDYSLALLDRHLISALRLLARARGRKLLLPMLDRLDPRASLDPQPVTS